MKKITLSFLASAVCCTLLFTSCGNKTESSEAASGDSTKVEEAPAADFAGVCKTETKLAITIKDYFYGGEGKKGFTFAPTEFVVKNSKWDMTSDSTGTLILYNYTDDEMKAGQTDEQMAINVNIFTRKGKKIGPGSYVSDSQVDLGATTTFITNKGTVYFNWSAGMPETGTFTINYADKNGICGEFKLNADKPDIKWIGTVKLNGPFKVGK